MKLQRPGSPTDLRKHRFLAAAVLFIVLAPSVEAADTVVLGVANTSGQHTRLSISNRSATATQVKISLTTSNPATVADPVPITIGPMATVVYEDALADLWSLADQRGVVTVSGSQPLLVTA